MSFLSRLFGSGRAGDPPRDVDGELERLEEEAVQARPGYVGTAFNKAGDLAFKSDQPDRAVGYYGRAIDAFLEDAQRELARGVANKIIRVRPTAVRTLCTLTWLDLAARHQAMALLHLRDYVDAARAVEQNARAATQIYSMARLSGDAQFLDAVADSLDSLDFPLRAKEVREWASTGSPGAIAEAIELADACLTAAVRSNDRDAVLLIDDSEGETLEADGEGTEVEGGSAEADEPAVQADEAPDESDESTDEPDASVGKSDGTSEAPDEAEVDSKPKGGESKQGGESKKNRKKRKKKR